MVIVLEITIIIFPRRLLFGSESVKINWLPIYTPVFFLPIRTTFNNNFLVLFAFDLVKFGRFFYYFSCRQTGVFFFLFVLILQTY